MCNYFHLTTACIFIQRLPICNKFSIFLSHEAAINFVCVCALVYKFS